ncbi:MAG TPA: NAD-dependent succinate-semialdehyde dehydrogenase [Sphingobacteriaceae bacterium]
MSIRSVNPANGEVIKEYQEFSYDQIASIIQAVDAACGLWRETSFADRSVFMNKAAQVLHSRKEEFARLMALEMGKPVTQGIAEVEKCAAVCEYYAGNAAQFLAPEVIKTEAAKSFVTFQPLGTVLAIMPWNFPFWQAFRFLAPGLMAGNCAVLKHASNVPGCALAIEKVMREAGFPENTFRTILVGSKAVDQIIENPLIKAVTLTGSTEAGKQIAQKAGSLLKKVVLELGGSDPYVILEDADLDLAAETSVKARLVNSGQSCIAAKRFIVVESVADTFTGKFLERMQAIHVGDPLDKATEIGPQARIELRDQLHEQVRKSVAAGAQCVLGGEKPDGNNAFYPPTILTAVKPGMPAYNEETFGPVASIIRAKDEDDAIRIANDTNFGLGAAIFTTDLIKAEHIAATRLEAGCCFVNAQVHSDPRLPFGGIKDSGLGRELGIYGIKEFVNIKTVFVK